MKIRMAFAGPVSQETVERNRRHAKRLGHSVPCRKDRPSLAVVGGGPSVAEHVDELRSWPGDIWIVCSAYPWCRKADIKGAFFSIDPLPEVADSATGAYAAVLASCSDPSVFAHLEGADVTVFDLYETDEESNHGATAVTAVPVLAREMGYEEVHFFGCDSSYAGPTHAYMNLPYPAPLTVQCDGKVYESSLQLLAQALCLSEVMRAAPEHFICRSGGLLPAMVRDGDYDIAAMQRHTAENLVTEDGRPYHHVHPMVPYEPAGVENG